MNKEEILNRFPREFQDMIHSSALANQTYHSLLAGASPEQVIGQLVVKYEELSRQYRELMMKTPVQYIVKGEKPEDHKQSE